MTVILMLLSCQPSASLSCPEGMILLSGGKMKLGIAKNQPWQLAQQEVQLEPYCIDQYEFPNKKGVKPTIKVSWEEAVGLCAQQGKRLCSEQEWEAACRGSALRRYSYGNTMESERCNTGSEQPQNLLKESGSFADCHSPEGVYDLNGSLSEWTSSSWTHFNPQSKEAFKESWKVLRGGTMWSDTHYGQDCNSRHGHNPQSWRNIDDGLRCCKGL